MLVQQFSLAAPQSVRPAPLVAQLVPEVVSQTPFVHVPELGQATADPHVPLAVHVWTPLPMHRLASGAHTPPPLDDEAPDDPPDPLALDPPDEALPDDDPDDPLPDPELLADDDVEAPLDDPTLPPLLDEALVTPDSTVLASMASSSPRLAVPS
jgi:hypothetical protein